MSFRAERLRRRVFVRCAVSVCVCVCVCVCEALPFARRAFIIMYVCGEGSYGHIVSLRPCCVLGVVGVVVVVVVVVVFTR